MKRAARWGLFGLFCCAVIGAAASILLAAWYVSSTPYPVSSLGGDFARVLTDRHGTPIRERPGADGAYGWRVTLDDVDPLVVAATVAAEDRRFWAHPGVDLLALGRATLQAVTSGEVVSGASTLTMQLARSATLRERTAWGKAVEMLDAMRIERRFSKEEILAAYLNRVSYGPRVIGVEAAARLYLGKSAAHLSAAEAAVLAGLPKSPVGYDPWAHPEAARARARHVLARMEEEEYLRPVDRARAEEELAGLAFVAEEHPLGAPHYAVRALAAANGADVIEGTIDLPLQIEAEVALREELLRLAYSGVTDAAAVVIENDTGEVLVWIGSPDFYDPLDGQVDGVRAPRQPGSTLKPFVYALALEGGWTAATIIPDVPTEFDDPGLPYVPGNYDGAVRGPVRLREALAGSLNIPAVHAAARVGVAPLLEGLHRFGFASLTEPPEHYGLALALGDGEVTPLELAAAYATLARGGLYKPPVLIRSARTADGDVLARTTHPAVRVAPPDVAALIADILADRAAGLAPLTPGARLGMSVPVSAKTGTSSGFRDRWTVGFTSEVTVAVWVGNFDGSPAHGLPGAAGAMPLFAKIVELAMRGRDADTPVPEAELETARVCSLSGALPGSHCPTAIDEKFLAGTVPEHRCAMHVAILIDLRSGLRAGPGCPPEHVLERVFTELPDRHYDAWLSEEEHTSDAYRFAPPAWSPHCPPDPGVDDAGGRPPRVVYPRPGALFVLDPNRPLASQAIALRAELPGTPENVAWHVDGRLLARVGFPYRVRLPLTPGVHEVTVESAGGIESPPVVFEVR